MRTEQFLEGYDSARRDLQSLLNDLHVKGKISEDLVEIVKFASHPYYERDGKDWKPGDEPIVWWDE